MADPERQVGEDAKEPPLYEKIPVAEASEEMVLNEYRNYRKMGGVVIREFEDKLASVGSASD